MMFWHSVISVIRILGLISILGMGVTGKQAGGKTLHWVYRALILVTILLLGLLFFFAKQGSLK
jgi:hypothetical protein